MSGLKFDKTITLGDLCTALVIATALVGFGLSLKYRLDYDERQLAGVVQAQQQFQQSLSEEKDARIAYQNDNDKSVTEMWTILKDRLNFKP